jgi:hypothetical protein
MQKPTSFSAKRCYNHGDREVVAKCTHCGHFFCRECISEYLDRITCAACIRSLQSSEESGAIRASRLLIAGKLLLSLLICYLAFFTLAQLLCAIPHQFHDTTFINEEAK